MLITLKNKDTLKLEDHYLRCSNGKNGITSQKKEGDKCTPKGIFKLGRLYYRADRVKKPKTKISTKIIKKNMGWCDDVTNKYYNKNIKIFIQVNIGDEPQKSGISPDNLLSFKNKCVDELNLNIIGLMCLPPINKEPSVYFKEMNYLLKKIDLKELSMGMSNDYLEAVNYNSSYVRIGSKIFGNRN